MKPLDYVRGLSPLAHPYRRYLAVMIVLGLLAALSEGVGLSLFLPLFYSLGQPAGGSLSGPIAGIFERLFSGIEPAQRLPLIGGSIFAAVLVKNVLQYALRVLHAWIDGRLLRIVRARVMRRYLTGDLASVESTNTGTLLNTLENETWDTSSSILHAVTCIIHVITIAVLASLLLLISWPLMLLVTGAMATVSLVIFLLTRRVEHISRDAIRADETYAQRSLEMLRGMRTIRLFNLEKTQQEAFDASSKGVAGTYFQKLATHALVHPLSELLVSGILIGVLFAGAGTPETLPGILTFIFILYRLHPQIKQLDQSRTELLTALPSAETVLNALHGIPDEASATAADFSPIETCPTITFENVHFRYAPAGPAILAGASFAIPSRSVTAIVGPSGAGKSTLIHLLTRFNEAESGRILLDGMPLDSYPVEYWRRQVGVVTHDAFLFNTSIAENIRNGRQEASFEEIVAAARLANAHDFISRLPEGYETNVADLGARLSTGQRQRVALARAILREPGVLILDEATNALDSISEDFVRRTLSKLRGSRTIVLIAHRLSTIRQADHLVVLNGGCVAESGTFEELVDRGGLFTQLFELQHVNHPSVAV